MPETPIHDLAVTDAKVSTLKFYKDNPREGDVAAIAESLKTVGQYKPIVVNKGTHTGRANEVLAGNHTLKAAKSLKWPSIKVVHVDVGETEAAILVLADNKTADLGGYNADTLANLLVDLPDLTGTGYTLDELDDMLADQREAAEEAANAAADNAAGKEPEPDKKYGDDDSGMLNRKSLDEKLEGYTTSDSRSIILSYQGDAYIWIVEKLTELGEKFDTPSNAETVLQLIEEATGDKAPIPAPADATAEAEAA